MKQLEDRWAEVTASRTAQKEAEAVERVWELMGEERFSLEMLGKTPDGQDVDMIYGEHVAGVRSLRVSFEREGVTRTFAWTPIDLQNAYILVRE